MPDVSLENQKDMLLKMIMKKKRGEYLPLTFCTDDSVYLVPSFWSAGLTEIL